MSHVTLVELAPGTFEFRLPDLGEGVVEGEIVTWMVKPGDVVAEDQTLVEIMTDKATVEIPSPKAGTVTETHGKEGDMIPVGKALVVIAAAGAVAPPKAVAQAPAPAPLAMAAPLPAASVSPTPTAQSGGSYAFRLPDLGEGVVEGEIVAWLVKAGDVVQEDQALVEIMTDKATVEIPSPKAGQVLRTHGNEGDMVPVGHVLVEIASKDGAVAPAAPAHGHQAPAAMPSPAAAPVAVLATGGKVLASPATRKLARDQGLDLSTLVGTGPHGRITKEDLRNHLEGVVAPKAVPSAAPAQSKAAPAALVVSGDVERRPLKGLRRKIAEKMSTSAFTIPHVTTVDELDMTALIALRKKLKPKAEALGVKLSFMPFFFKAVVAAVRQFPLFNASLDEAAQEIVIKKDVHMGFAAATDQGLMVPVVKHANRKGLLQMAEEMGAIAERTRNGKASLDEITGSTITVSNVGSVGGLFATPIINHPEVCILGVNQMQERAVVRDGQIVVRPMMYLGLSFDHRVTDGAEAVRFLRTIIEYLEDPDLLLLEA